MQFSNSSGKNLQIALAKAMNHSNKQAKHGKIKESKFMNHSPNSNSHLNNWLGLNWQLSLSSGWGIAGLNMSHEMEVDGRFRAVPLLSQCTTGSCLGKIHVARR